MARPNAGAGLTTVEAAPMGLDEPAFDLAYRAYAPRLRAVAYAVLRDRDAAEDAVHGALARVLGGALYRSERGALLPFLVACVRREALDAVRGSARRHAREVRAVAGEPVAFDATGAVDPVEARRVRAALDTLPTAQRDVVLRVYFSGRTLAEASRELGVPLGTVKSRLSAALRALHTALSEGSR